MFIQIPSQCMTCVKFQAFREHIVGKTAPVPIKVYDYYEPGRCPFTSAFASAGLSARGSAWIPALAHLQLLRRLVSTTWARTAPWPGSSATGPRATRWRAQPASGLVSCTKAEQTYLGFFWKMEPTDKLSRSSKLKIIFRAMLYFSVCASRSFTKVCGVADQCILLFSHQSDCDLLQRQNIIDNSGRPCARWDVSINLKVKFI